MHMNKAETQYPAGGELSQYGIRAFKGIDFGLDQADSMATVAAKLKAHYPNHMDRRTV